MCKCIKCKKEFDDIEERIFGIVQRYHYDNRNNTADIDSGPTTYTPYALIRVRLCRECQKTIKEKNLSFSIAMLAGGIAALVLAFTIGRLSSLIFGILLIGGAIAFILGLVGTINNSARGKDSDSYFLEAIRGKTVEKENVIYPHTDKDLNVERIQKNLLNRHDYQYFYYDKKDLMKPEKGGGRKDSNRLAKDTLRRWAREQNLFTEGSDK